MNTQKIPLTSATSEEVKKRIQAISAQVMKRNREVYKRLAHK